MSTMSAIFGTRLSILKVASNQLFLHNIQRSLAHKGNERVAIITGAAQGLGKAIADKLLQNGNKVVIADNNVDVANKTLSHLQKKYGKNKVLFVKCNVSNKNDMEALFSNVKKQFHCIDILVNNAAVGFEKKNWENTVDVNLKGTIQGTNLAIEHMRKDKGGHGGVIVNVSSVAGLFPNPVGPIFSSTQSAIITFSQSWTKNTELAANGIRINVLAPSLMDTPLIKTLGDSNIVHMSSQAQKEVANVGLMAPETVADAAMELINDQSKNAMILKVTKASGKEYHKV